MRRHVCHTSCIAAVHTCVRHPDGSPRAAIRQIHFFVLDEEVRPPHVNQCQYLSFTFTCCDLRQHDFHPLQRRCRRIQLGSGVSFATHLVCSLGFPGCPLSVSAHPVLDGGAFQFRVSTPLWELSHTSCVDGCTPPLHVLPHSSGSSHPPFVVVPVPSFPRVEQLLLVLMHEFLHLAIRSLPPFPRISSSCLFFFSCSSLALAPWRTHVPVCSFLPIGSSASTRACRCVPVH